MKSINLNQQFKDLDGNDLQGESMAKTLANVISNSKLNSNIIKFYDWAITLHTKGVIDCDNQDHESLVEFVLKTEHLSLAGKAQITKALNEQDKYKGGDNGIIE